MNKWLGDLHVLEDVDLTVNRGAAYDQPGFGQQNPTTGKVEGFDVEIAQLLAVGIFGGDVSSVEG